MKVFDEDIDFGMIKSKDFLGVRVIDLK